MHIPLDNFKCVLSLLLICRERPRLHGSETKRSSYKWPLIHQVPSQTWIITLMFLTFPTLSSLPIPGVSGLPFQSQVHALFLILLLSLRAWLHHFPAGTQNVYSNPVCVSPSQWDSQGPRLVMSLLCPAFQINLQALTLSPFPIPPIWHLLAFATVSLFFVAPGTYQCLIFYSPRFPPGHVFSA